MEEFNAMCELIGLEPDKVRTIRGEQDTDGNYVVVVVLEPDFSKVVYEGKLQINVNPPSE